MNRVKNVFTVGRILLNLEESFLIHNYPVIILVKTLSILTVAEGCNSISNKTHFPFKLFTSEGFVFSQAWW